MSHYNERVCQPVTLLGYAEWPKVADAVIEAASRLHPGATAPALRRTSSAGRGVADSDPCGTSRTFRWRSGRSRARTAPKRATGPKHNTEAMSRPLPGTRYEHTFGSHKNGVLDSRTYVHPAIQVWGIPLNADGVSKCSGHIDRVAQDSTKARGH
jgi:hypothetical protein